MVQQKNQMELQMSAALHGLYLCVKDNANKQAKVFHTGRKDCACKIQK